MDMNIGPAFSRRRLALGFATSLAFASVPAFAWGKRGAGENAAEKFLGSIYQHYLSKSSAAAAGVPLTDAQSVRSYFTFALASLILEWDVSDLSVDVKDTAGFKTVGTVTFINFGKPEKVVLELLRSGKEFRAAYEWIGAERWPLALLGCRGSIGIIQEKQDSIVSEL